jgi:hypothetical protein
LQKLRKRGGELDELSRGRKSRSERMRKKEGVSGEGQRGEEAAAAAAILQRHESA